MNVMKMSWQTDPDRLVCRWSEAGEHIRYNPPWVQDDPGSTPGDNHPPTPLVFTKLSPFGGAHWFGPH